MSDSVLIPREQAAACSRWEMASFDAPSAVRGGAAGAHSDAELNAAVRAAYERGRAEGLGEGLVRAQAAAQAFAALADAARRQIDATGQALAEDTVALALEVARRIAGQVFETRPDAVIAAVHEALGSLQAPAVQAQMVLHPADLPLVREHLGSTLDADGWVLLADPQMQRGGCHLRTRDCDVDATLSTRWQRIAAALGQESAWIR